MSVIKVLYVTPIETTRFMLDLPLTQTENGAGQRYFGAVENRHNPLHEAVKDTKGCRLGRGKSWMGQAEDSILQVWQLTELKQTKERERYLTDSGRLVSRDTPTRTEIRESTAGNGQQAKRSQRSSFHSRNQQTAGPHSVH